MHSTVKGKILKELGDWVLCSTGLGDVKADRLAAQARGLGGARCIWTFLARLISHAPYTHLNLSSTVWRQKSAKRLLGSKFRSHCDQDF